LFLRCLPARCSSPEGTAAAAIVIDGTLTVSGRRDQTWTGEPPSAQRALQAFVADLREQPIWEALSTGDVVRVAQLLGDTQRLAAKH